MVIARLCAANRDSRAATSAMTSRTNSETLVPAARAKPSRTAFVASSNRIERVTVLADMYDSIDCSLHADGSSTGRSPSGS